MTRTMGESGADESGAGDVTRRMRAQLSTPIA
jgi:hypothetical protein